MIALIQRVKIAQVFIKEALYSGIDDGILVYIAVEKDDTEQSVLRMANKLRNIRVFEEDEKYRNIIEVKKQMMLVSEFTLAGELKGNRFSHDNSMRSGQAVVLYDLLVSNLKSDIALSTGIFGAMMEVYSSNNGPITYLIKCS